MSRWRIVVHALDRTGPPVLALTWLRWLRREHPGDAADVVAIRGGVMQADFEELADVVVLVAPNAALPHGAERTRLFGPFRSSLPDVDATLLVSVAAGPALAALPAGPVATWCVEAGSDLHWVETEPELTQRTDQWLAGSQVSANEIESRLSGCRVHLVPEFVDPARPGGPERRAYARHVLSGGTAGLVVVAAGIATWRKAPDLFVEVALAHSRAGRSPACFAWIGGDSDELHQAVSIEADRTGSPVRFVPAVADIDTFLSAADVLLHTARLDSFPLVCLHAATAGTPVVSFRGTGGPDEMFGPTLRGADFPDVVGLAHAIDELSDPTARAEAATQQRERVSARWVTEVGAPVLLQHLRETAGEGATR